MRYFTVIFLSGMFIAVIIALAANAPTARASGPWYVDGTDGDDSYDCLSWATACETISKAITNSATHDTIYVASGVYTVSNLLIVNRTVIGAGAGQTILDGNYSDRVLQTSGLTSIYSVTIRHGLASGGNDGGGIFNWSILRIENSVIEENEASNGGAIRSDNSLTIRNSTFRNNIAQNDGGAIYNRGTLIVENSTFSENHTGGFGALYHGGFFQDHTATLTNTTISNNKSPNYVAGIYFYTGTLVLVNDTIANNVNETNLSASGLNVYTGVLSTTNTIVSNNSPWNCTDLSGNVIQSNGHNLDSGASCGFNASGDISNTNPLLGPLQNNGGPTWTHALLSGSPAFNQGSNNRCPGSDQRGIARPQLGICDIGAYEIEATEFIYLPLVLKNP